MTDGTHLTSEGGLRTRGKFHKQSTLVKPLVTVITVVRNGKEHLEDTIQSVLSQTYDNIEYIVIDGGSTDGTIDIIKKYDEQLAYWISEPDNGIYDAMNKGIAHATGEWINFMNAGDSFYTNDVIAKIFTNSAVHADVIYGDHHVVYDRVYSKVHKAGEIKDLWKGMIFCHQSSFTRTPLMKRQKFNSQNRIAADFEALYSLSLNNHTFHNTGLVISSVAAEGLSGTNTLLAVKEQWMVVRKLSNSFFKNMFYAYLIIKRIGKNMVKAALPQNVVNRIRVKL
jgi:glycosyltransferase involved in cell wall biosynthesis